MALPAEIHWSNPELDRQAQARRHDWSALQGLDQLWPELERLYGDAVALVAPMTPRTSKPSASAPCANASTRPPPALRPWGWALVKWWRCSLKTAPGGWWRTRG